MADNEILIDLLARSDFQKAIEETNRLKLSIQQLQSAASLAGSNRIPFFFNSTELLNSGNSWRRLRQEVAATIPVLTRVYREAQASGVFGALALSQNRLPALSARAGQLALPPPGGIGALTTIQPPDIGSLSYGGGGGRGQNPAGGGAGNGGSPFGRLFAGFAFLRVAGEIKQFVSSSVEEFSKFELAVKRISVVSGESASDISKGILELAKVVPFSIDELSQSFLVAGQAGLKSAEEIKSVTFAASLLSFRFGDDLSNSTKKLIQITNQFNISVGQSGALIGLLAKVSGDTLTDVNALSTALARAGATAKASGLSIFETVTAIGGAAQSGIESQRAGTELRRLITQIEKISSGTAGPQKGALALKLFGPNFKQETDIAKVGLSSIVDKLADMNVKSSELSILVGETPARILTGLIVFDQKLKQSGDSLSALKQRFEEGKISVEDYKNLFGSLNAEQQIFKNRLDELKISFGEAFKPLVEVGIIALEGFLSLVKAIPPQISILAISITGITAALIGLKLILPIIGQALAGIGITFGAGLLASIATFGVYALLAASATMALARAFNVWKASSDAGNGPFQSFIISAWDLLKINPLIKEAADRVSFLARAAFVLFPKDVQQRILDFGKTLKDNLGIHDVNTDAMALSDTFKDLVENLKSINQADVDKKFQELTDSINKQKLAAEQLDLTLSKYHANFTQMTIDSQEDFQKMAESMVSTWTDSIYDLITGAKTFADVWQDIQNYALKSFIEGFLKGMVNSFNQSLGQMLANYMMMPFNTGFGGGGGLGSLFSAFSGGASAGGTAGAFADVSSLSSANIPGLGFAEGGIATKPTFGVFGEAGPEALIPLDRMGSMGGSRNITVVNVVDQNFVHQSLSDNPDVIINSINADLIRNGTTRKTIKRYTQ